MNLKDDWMKENLFDDWKHFLRAFFVLFQALHDEDDGAADDMAVNVDGSKMDEFFQVIIFLSSMIKIRELNLSVPAFDGIILNESCHFLH